MLSDKDVVKRGENNQVSGGAKIEDRAEETARECLPRWVFVTDKGDRRSVAFSVKGNDYV